MGIYNTLTFLWVDVMRKSFNFLNSMAHALFYSNLDSFSQHTEQEASKFL